MAGRAKALPRSIHPRQTKSKKTKNPGVFEETGRRCVCESVFKLDAAQLQTEMRRIQLLATAVAT